MGKILYLAQSKHYGEGRIPKIQNALSNAAKVQFADDVEQVIKSLGEDISAVVIDVDPRTVGFNSDNIRKIFQARTNGTPPVYASTNHSSFDFQNLPKGIAGIIHFGFNDTQLLTPT